MRAIICTLAKLALRHYRDPLSWSALVISVGAAAHIAIPPEYVGPLDAILAGIVSLLLAMADGRKNPNTDPGTGAIPPRVQGEPPDKAAAAPGTTGARNNLSYIRGPDVRQPDDPGPQPHRPGFGPY